MRSEKTQSILKIVLGAIITFGVLFGVIRGFMSGYPGAIKQFVYFTVQSNVIVLVTVVLLFTKLKEAKWYKYLSIIALVNILMTGIIYNTLLQGFWTSSWIKQGAGSFFHHLVVPLTYGIMYFIVAFKPIKLSKVWVTLIYPALYFFVYLLIVEPLTGFSPYPFMSVTYDGNSWGSVLITCVLVILPIICVFTLGLVYLKSLVEKKYLNNQLGN